MARIVDYQETTTPANNDVLLIETEDGTRKVKKSVLLKAVLDLIGDTDISDIGDGTTTGAISVVEQQVTEMKQSFQVGVDTIYGAITGRGVQPSGSTPSDCAAAINTMYSPESYTNYGTDRYNAGRSQGRTDVGGTFQAGQIFSVSDESSTSYSVEANHYYLFIGTATSDTTGITIKSGATLVGQYSTKGNAQNGTIAIGALVKTTSTTVALILSSGWRGVIAAVKLGLCR